VGNHAADPPAHDVFTRRDGMIRHFWSQRMGAAAADPDQDPRGGPDIDPSILEPASRGCGKDGHPRLDR
jgi:hypothetical protein